MYNPHEFSGVGIFRCVSGGGGGGGENRIRGVKLEIGVPCASERGDKVDREGNRDYVV
jgi:hypothetical protein